MSFTIGVIGTGRAGGATARALAAVGFRVGPLWSRSAVHSASVASTLSDAWTADTPQAVAESAELVLVAVPDRAIAQVVGAIAWRPDIAVVHLSGGSPLSVLDGAARAGCPVGGWHPLKSFAGVPTDADLNGVTVAVEAPEPLRTTLHGLARAAGARPFDLPPEARIRYHASAALASNALVALLAQAAALWQDWGATRTEGLAALLPLVRGTVANLGSAGLPAALTGPVERGDVSTVCRHLGALDTAPVTAGIYRVLSAAALILAEEKGGISRENATALRALLDCPTT